jgi:transmembrane protein TMEM260 (protein O-mannosyltransferase)
MPSVFSALCRRANEVFLHSPALFISMLALGFYLYTLAPSVNWADGARMQMDVMLGGSSYAFMDEVASMPTDGLPFDRLGVAAWDHPVYVMLGQLFLLIPAQDPAYRTNLMSAIMATLAIWFTYRLTFCLVKDHWATAIGVAALIVSHTFWFHAVTTEVYTLNILFIAILVEQIFIWAEMQKWRALYIFSLIAGLGTANHRLFPLVVLPAGAAIFMSSNNWRKLVRELLGWPGIKMALLFIAGFSPWWIQFIRIARIIGPSLTWDLAGTFSLIESRLSSNSWSTLVINLIAYFGWLLYQFTPIGLGLGILGIWWGYKNHSKETRFLAITLILHVAFSANFSVVDRFTFHLPSYWIFSIYIAFGAKYLQSCLESSRLKPTIITNIRTSVMAGIIILPIGLYSITPKALKWYGITETDFGVFPIGIGVRDTARYFLNPNKRGDHSAEEFGRTTMEMLAPQALVLTPKTSEQEVYLVLRYFQRVQRMRPDVRIDMMLFTPIDDMLQAVFMEIQSQIPCRPIYITSLNPSSFPLGELEQSFKIIPEANLFRVIPHSPFEQSSVCPPLDNMIKAVTLQELILEHWP